MTKEELVEALGKQREIIRQGQFSNLNTIYRLKDHIVEIIGHLQEFQNSIPQYQFTGGLAINKLESRLNSSTRNGDRSDEINKAIYSRMKKGLFEDIAEIISDLNEKTTVKEAD